MNRTTSCNIDSTQILKKSMLTPNPVDETFYQFASCFQVKIHLPSCWNAIDDRVEEGKNAISLEVASLRHGATYNRCGGSREG